MSGVPPEMAGTLNELREALDALPDFGTAAERDVGTGTGDVMEVGAGGWLADAFPAYAGDLNDIAVTCITLVGPAATNAPHPGEYSFVLTLSAGSGGRAQFALCVSDSADPQWRASATDGTGYGGWAALGGGGGGGSIVSLASTFNGAVSLDVQAVQYPYGALTGNSTFAFSNIPAINYWEWRIEIANPGTRTWTFPTHSNLYWQGYTAKPPLRETGVTALQFWVRDYGTTNKILRACSGGGDCLMGRFMSATGAATRPGSCGRSASAAAGRVHVRAARALSRARHRRGAAAAAAVSISSAAAARVVRPARFGMWGELHVNEGDSFRAMYYNITGRARSLRFERDAGSGIYVVALGGYDGESNVVTGNGVAGAAGDSSSLAPFNAFGKRFEAGAGGAGGSSGGGGNPSNGGGNGGAGGIKMAGRRHGRRHWPSAPAADGGLDLPYGGAGGTGIGAGGGGSPGSYSATMAAMAPRMAVTSCSWAGGRDADHHDPHCRQRPAARPVGA